MRSVYIHMPFCSSICSYCDFCKLLYTSSWVDEYLNELEKEINEFYDKDILKSIYIGGGTPSSLNINELTKLFQIIKIFQMDKRYEFTFEMNINDINEEKLQLLKSNGVNRLSIGVESFNDINLKYMNRKHNKNSIFTNINIAKKYFDNINVDIIFALPCETFSVFKKDVKEILKLEVQHISSYSLIIEPNTVLHNNGVKSIDEEVDYQMYEYLCKKLKKHGYEHYEVSNFSLHGYESIHNKTYWLNEEYYGFGLGAHGFIGGLRYENTRSFNKYLSSEYRLNEVFLSKKEDMENEIMLGLRLLNGINIVNFFNKYNVNIQDEFNILPMLKKGMLILKDNYLFIPENKIYIMNEILNTIIK